MPSSWALSWGNSWAGAWGQLAPLVEVPDVLGETEADGTTALEAEGFVVQVVSEYSDSVAVGLIMAQSPSGGSDAPEGSTVVITVSLGESTAADSFLTRARRRGRR